MTRSYKRALVTGGAGFIGSHLVERLLETGVNVVLLDDLSTGQRENVPADAELIVGDIRDDRAVGEALSGVDVVFHLAARVSIRDSFRGLQEDADVNVMGTINLLKQFSQSKAQKFVYASSMATYGTASKLPIHEEATVEPTSPYGISKLAGEQYVLCMCQHSQKESVVLRYFNTYGTRQTLTPYVGVITIFIQKLLDDQVVPIFGDGSQQRDFISVEDVAEATRLAMDYSGEQRIFNVGSGTGKNINEIAELLQKLMDKPRKIEHLPEQPGEPADSIADISRARKELGFTPRCTLEKKLPQVIQWNIHKMGLQY